MKSFIIMFILFTAFIQVKSQENLAKSSSLVGDVPALIDGSTSTSWTGTSLVIDLKSFCYISSIKIKGANLDGIEIISSGEYFGSILSSDGDYYEFYYLVSSSSSDEYVFTPDMWRGGPNSSGNTLISGRAWANSIFLTSNQSVTINEIEIIGDKDYASFNNMYLNSLIIKPNPGLISGTNPYLLDVEGDINFTGNLLKNGELVSAGGNSLWSTTGSNIYFNSGSIGLGTPTPNSAYKLDVVGDINLTGTLRQNGLPFSGSQWATSTSASNTISYTGNVNINSDQSSGSTLTVKGKIVASGVEVLELGNINFPDYVFAPSYKLRPLHEVEKYVQINRHLPEVPSEKEFKANGMNLVEMNATLLKKVEELTLYMIELKKDNDRQNELIKELQRK